MNYTKLLNKLLNEAYLHGGATLNLKGEKVIKGYAVGTQNIYTGNMPEKREESAIAIKMMKSKASNFKSHFSIGIWSDPKTHTVYIDAVRVYRYKVQAIYKARRHNEIAIYNLRTQETIYT